MTTALDSDVRYVHEHLTIPDGSRPLMDDCYRCNDGIRMVAAKDDQWQLIWSDRLRGWWRSPVPGPPDPARQAPPEREAATCPDCGGTAYVPKPADLAALMRALKAADLDIQIHGSIRALRASAVIYANGEGWTASGDDPEAVAYAATAKALRAMEEKR